MSTLTDLPVWVYELVAGISRYEDEHPLLYRMAADASYERTPCVNSLTSLIPIEVQDAAELLVKHGAITPTSVHTSPDHDEATP